MGAAAGDPARRDPCGLPAGADRHADRGQLLRLRQRPDHPGLRVDQLPRCAGLGHHVVDLSRNAEVHRDRLGAHLADRLLARLFSVVRRAEPHLADDMVPGLHGALPHLEHHPHDLLGAVPWTQRVAQWHAAAPGTDPRTIGVPAVLRLRGGAGVRASLHAVHGGADLQQHGAHRPPADRGRDRRRRPPLARGPSK